MSESFGPSELSRLLVATLDGSLDAAQFSRLKEILNSHPEARQYYVDFMTLCAQLHQQNEFSRLVISPESLGPGDANIMIREALDYDEQAAAAEMQREGETRREIIEKEAEVALERFRAQERLRQQELAYRRYLARRRQMAVGITATAALLVITVLVWIASRPARPVAAPPRARETTPPPPPIVATLTRVSQASWDRANEAPTVGMKLAPGPIRLNAGYMELTFENKAQLLVEAPADVNLVNERLVCLDAGVTTAYVPKSARGFEVDTPSVRVTDLGTEFGLVVDSTGAVDVHVLDGWVATSFASTGQQAQRVKALYQNSAMHFDAQAGIARSISVKEDRFARSWDDVLYKPRTEGAIRFVQEMPPSLRKGADRDDSIHLFLERVDVRLTRKTAVDITAPGTYEVFTGSTETLPAGSKVDSYLIHWEPETENGRKETLSGRITFRRPVLGLITDVKRLAASDATFKRRGTVYPGNELARRLESAPTVGYDTVVLSPDRLTLEITLSALAMDQVRVLVTAASDEEK